MIDVRHYGSSGPRVVLLHGGPGAPGCMAQLARLLSYECRVMEPLQRASGAETLSVGLHVADLREVLRATKEGYHLVGSSWGAMLALAYAARHPERLRHVVLIGCGTFDERARAVYQARFGARSNETDRERLQRIDAQLAEESEPARRNELFAELGEIAFRIESHDPVTTDLEITSVDERGYRETWADALILQRKGLHPAEFRSIRAPVLMLHGEVDPHPGRMIRDSLALVIENLAYHEFPRCGHVPWLERQAREEFLSVLMGVIKDVHDNS